MASTADPMEEVAKRMQGLKDSRSKIGELARGKNMYPSGNNAHSGPGGPDMGRPPEIPKAASDAVIQQTGGAPQPPTPEPMAQGLQQLQAKFTSPPKYTAQQGKAVGGLAQASLQAAAKRKMQRSK